MRHVTPATVHRRLTNRFMTPTRRQVSAIQWVTRSLFMQGMNNL